MNPALRVMEEQIRLWSTQVEDLCARPLVSGASRRFEAVMTMDELKALLVIAQSHLDGYRAADLEHRVGLEPDLETAWVALATAMGNSR